MPELLMSSTDGSANTILLVDDTPENLLVLTRSLKQQGYQIRSALNGPAALQSVQNDPPDLILLDIMLPDMDGYEVCRQLKADPTTRDIPVMFISALNETLDKVKAFEVGGVDYLSRPLQMQEALIRIATHLKLRDVQRQLEHKLDEYEQMKAVVEERNRKLWLLSRINQMFSSSLNLTTVLDTVLGEIQRLLDVVSISFWLAEVEKQELVCLQAKGAGSENLAQWRLPIGQGITGWAASQNRSVLVADTWQDERYFKDIDAKTGFAVRSMLSIPLQVQGRMIGILNLVDPRVGRFTEEDVVFLEPIAAAAATAIENARLYTSAQQHLADRERMELELRESQRYAQSIIDSSLDMIIAVDTNRNIIEFNKAAQATFGYTLEEVFGKHISMLYGSAEDASQAYYRVLQKERHSQEILNKRKNGEVFPCLLSASLLYDTHGVQIGSMGISREITEQKRTELRQTIVYLISEAAQTTKRLDELFPAIREIVGQLMPVENFYIAFYDERTEMISFPYYVENGVALKRPPRKFGGGLAEYVLRTGLPLLFTPEYREELIKRGEMKPVFFSPTVVDWLGVPLKFDNRIIGILTVRSHSSEIRLGDAEKNLLMFASTQIATAIERKRSEELLDRLRKAFETTNVGITITDTTGHIVYTNPADAAMHGYTVEELFGKPSNIFSLLEAHESDKTSLSHRDIFPNWKRERLNVRKDGSVFPVKLISNPIYDREGGLLGQVTICEDITDLKHAERLLQESEERYRGIVENAATGIFQATPEGRFITANPALARILGYASAHDLMTTVTNIAEQLYVEPRHWRDITDMLVHTHERASVETRCWHKDGGEVLVLLNIWAVCDERGQPCYLEGFVDDITERKQMEKTLFRQATLLRSVARAMTCLLINPDFPAAIAEVLELLGFATEVDRIHIFENYHDPDTRQMSMLLRFEWVQDESDAQLPNPALAHLAYEPEFARWYAALSANKAVSGLVSDFPLSERQVLEMQQIRSLIVVPIMIGDRFWGFISFHSCHSERQWRGEEESILFAMAGSMGGAIARKQAEQELIAANQELQATLDDLQRTQTQLVRSEKLAALGQLIAGVAHEINTPLGAIRSAIGDIAATITGTLETLPGYLHSLSVEHREAFFALLQRAQQKNVQMSSREERHLKRALLERLTAAQVDDARRIAEMLVNIGVYEDLEDFLPVLRDPDHHTMLNMVYRLSGLHESTHTITTAVDRASKVVFALRTYVRRGQEGQMIRTTLTDGLETVLTLYYNQIKHDVEVIRNYEPIPDVLCFPDELNQVWTNLIHNALQAMEYKGRLTIAVKQQETQVVVSISDTGKGIPPEIQDRIFEPFFTTKPAGEGTGLGLDIVRKIVDKHHGRIQFESRPGQTTFQVWLPMEEPTL